MCRHRFIRHGRSHAHKNDKRPSKIQYRSSKKWSKIMNFKILKSYVFKVVYTELIRQKTVCRLCDDFSMCVGMGRLHPEWHLKALKNSQKSQNFDIFGVRRPVGHDWIFRDPGECRPCHLDIMIEKTILPICVFFVVACSCLLFEKNRFNHA